MNSRIFLYVYRRIIFAVIFLYNPSQSHFFPSFPHTYTCKLRLGKLETKTWLRYYQRSHRLYTQSWNCSTILFSFLSPSEAIRSAQRTFGYSRGESGSVINRGRPWIFEFSTAKVNFHDVCPSSWILHPLFKRKNSLRNEPIFQQIPIKLFKISRKMQFLLIRHVRITLGYIWIYSSSITEAIILERASLLSHRIAYSDHSLLEPRAKSDRIVPR